MGGCATTWPTPPPQPTTTTVITPPPNCRLGLFEDWDIGKKAYCCANHRIGCPKPTSSATQPTTSSTTQPPTSSITQPPTSSTTTLATTSKSPTKSIDYVLGKFGSMGCADKEFLYDI